MRGLKLSIAAMALAVLPAAGAAASIPSPVSALDGLQGEKGDRAITYVGTIADQPDLAAQGLGTSGWWFPQLAAPAPVEGAPTGDNARDGLPAWVAAFNHTTSPADPGCTELGALERGCTPTYNFRTFSQDGPARSSGGHAPWSRLRIPDGECGTAGAIVDPHTFAGEQDQPDPTGVFFPAGEPRPNNNNTMNRIQLQAGAPASFFVSVVTDATSGDHEPGDLQVRGNVGMLDVPSEVADSQIESAFASPIALSPNGVPDVHTFRVDGFVDGDYLKLRLKGATSPAGFSGLLFDESFDPRPVRRPVRGDLCADRPGRPTG